MRASVPRPRRQRARCGWRSSTASRKSSAGDPQGAGQLRVQLGESILPLAGPAMERRDKVRCLPPQRRRHEIGYAFARSST
jgi:hypothetical protein